MNPLNALIPIAPREVAAQYRWGTVTTASPLAVQLDGDTEPLAGVPVTLETVALGARVLVLIHDRRAVVLGSAK